MRAMASAKTQVIRQLFLERYDPTTRSLSRDVVTFDDLARAIRGTSLSSANLANFFKDLVRSPTRNENFPPEVVESGYTAEQYIGSVSRGCFRFTPLPEGQTVAFAERTPAPELFEDVHIVQSLSLNRASRLLGRRDESWLTQVAVNLNLVATHLALHSPLRLVSVELLQTNVKLRNAEIDALFVAQNEDEVASSQVLVCVEMKHRREMLEDEQILRGAEAAGREAAERLDLQTVTVVPMGIKALADGLVWIVEFSHRFPPLMPVSGRLYRLEPSVPGIS
jgi:hypothetical protein